MSLAGLMAAVITFVINGLYVALLMSEDEGNQYGFAWVIGLAGWPPSSPRSCPAADIRTPLLGGAALVLTAIGLLGIFSIGLPLLVAAGFAWAGCGTAIRAARRQWIRTG